MDQPYQPSIRSRIDIRFGALALEMGLVDPAALQRAIAVFYRRLAAGERISLGRILVEEGDLTTEGFQRILAAQEKVLFVCRGPACGRRFVISRVRTDREYRCKGCGSPLEPATDVSEGLVEEAGESASMPLVDPLEETRVAGRPGGVWLAPRARPSGSSRLGRFLEPVEIARGGMGTILRALDPQLNRSVALKILPAGRETDPGAVERFRREAQIAGQLEHPGIVPVYELGLFQDGAPYLAMKLVEGRTLAEILGEGGRPLSSLLSDFLKILDAVAFAHSRGVVHRDLKPANVMIGAFGEVQVMDWGVARIEGEGDPRLAAVALERGSPSTGPVKTMEGEVVGTPAYMPPEQAEGRIEEIDTRSDVYSLGAILYQILSGSSPFPGSNPWNVLQDVRLGRLVPPGRRARGREIPRELEAAVMKAMAREPRERYQSAAALRADIEAYLGGRALAAAGYSPWQLLAKWAGRNKIAVGGGAATAAALLVGTLAIVWVAGRAEAERLRSIEQTRLEAEADETHARRREGERRYEEGLARWDEAARTEVYNRAAPQEYFQSHAAALLAMGEGYEKNPERPAAWRETILERAGLLEDQAIEVGDWVLARVLVESTGNWAARTGGELGAARIRVRTALDRAAEEDAGRLDSALAEIEERERKGALLEGEIEERARRLARSTGPAATRRALELLAEERPAGLGCAYLASFLGRKADAETRFGATSAPGVVLAALEELGERPDPARADEGITWVRAAERFETIRPGTLRGLGAVMERLASAGAGPVAVAARRARERLAELEAGRSVIAGTRLGSGDWERAIADYADLTLARSRSGRRYLAHLVELVAAGAERRLSGSAAAFVHEAIGLAGDPLDGAVPALEAAFDRVATRLRGGGREALEAAVSAAIALSRLEAPGFSKKLQESREAVGQYSPFWNRTRLAMGLLALDWAEPDSAGAYTNRGNARKDRGDLAGAVADHTRAIELDPSFATAYTNRAIARHAQGDLAGAIADHTRAIELDPDCAPAYSNRGNARADQGDLGGAIADYARAIELAPDDAAAYGNRGVARYDQGDLAGAIEDYTRAIELEPDGAMAHGNRGNARCAQGDLDGAIADYTRAIELDPEWAMAYSNRGAALADRGDLAGAIEDFTRAIELDPDGAAAYGNRGNARHAQGDLGGAIADYTRALEIDPDFASAYDQRGIARREQGDLAGAVADSMRALEIDPGLASAYNNRGVARRSQGDLAGAIADYTRAIELDPDCAAAHVNRGNALLSQGDPAAAIADYARGIELDPRCWQAYATRGTALAALGRREEAAESFRGALERCPPSHRAAVEADRRKCLGD